MGWTSFNLNKPVKEWFINDYIGINNNQEVIDVSIIKRKTLYAAIRDKETNKVFALVFLLRLSPRSYYNFSYKDMDETMEPFYYDCPMKIINKLTATDNENSNIWRNKVLDYHNKMNIAKKSIIKIRGGIEFTNGMTYFYFKKDGHKIFAGRLLDNNIFSKECKVSINKFPDVLMSKECEFI